MVTEVLTVKIDKTADPVLCACGARPIAERVCVSRPGEKDRCKAFCTPCGIRVRANLRGVSFRVALQRSMTRRAR